VENLAVAADLDASSVALSLLVENPAVAVENPAVAVALSLLVGNPATLGQADSQGLALSHRDWARPGAVAGSRAAAVA
jgi:hypothetical protein